MDLPDEDAPKRFRNSVSDSSFNASPSNSQTEQLNGLASPLQIPEILQEIFKYLNSKCLLICRQVCKQWNQNSCRISLTRDDLYIHLDTQKCWDDLSDYMTNCDTPCLGFSIQSVNLYTEQATQFLQSCGPKIERIQIKCHQILDPVSPSMLSHLRNLLENYAPNISHLHLELSPHLVLHDHGDGDEPHKTTFEFTRALPHLRSFIVSNVQMLHIGQLIIRQILAAAINLQRFDSTSGPDAGASWGSRSMNVDYIDDLILTQKLPAMKTAALAPRSLFHPHEEDETKIIPMGYTKFWRLEKLADCPNLTIENLILHLDELFGSPPLYERMIQVLFKVFNKCQNTLKTIKMEPLGFLRHLKIPILFNVTQVCLYRTETINSTNCVGMFPMGIYMREIFPRVRTLIFDRGLHCEAIEFFCSHQIPMNSVKRLEINLQIYSPQKFFHLVATLLPNLTDLQINPFPPRRDLPAILNNVIDNFSQLKTLKMANFWLDSEDLETLQRQVLELDSAFTGIDVEELEKLSLNYPPGSQGHLDRPLSLDLQISGLTSLEMEIQVGKWSEFVQNGAQLKYPLFRGTCLLFRSLPHAKIIFCGDILETGVDEKKSNDNCKGIHSLAALLEPYVELKLKKRIN